MRLDEYQKWLDAQFLDTSPVDQAAASAVEEPPEPSVGDFDGRPAADLETSAVVEQFEHSAGEEAVPNLLPQQQTTPIPVFITRDTSADETDVPSIENYLPFLKSSRADESTSQIETDAAATDVHILDFDQTAGVAQAVVEVAPQSTESIQEDSGFLELTGEPLVEEYAKTTSDATNGREGDLMPSPTPSSAIGAGARMGRRVRNIHPKRTPTEITPTSLWTLVPKHIQVLVAMGSDEVAQNSYKRSFKESRIEMINHLLNPTLSLEDTARLINVCPTTVRRYTNRGLLTHQRTKGDQRRFKLSDVLAFLEAQTVKE